MFVVLDCSLVYSECIECDGEIGYTCLGCSEGHSLSTDGTCIGKTQR